MNYRADHLRYRFANSWFTIAAVGSLLLLAVWFGYGGFERPQPPQQGPKRSGLELASVGLSVVAQEGDGEGGQQQEAPRGLTKVVVARTFIPVGERLRPELLKEELRPADNVAVRAGVTIGNINDAVGRIVKTDISRGQAVLTPMIALSPTDLNNIGSDLALHVDNGRVAVAVPINQYSGAAYAMRPGDFVDVLMSFNLVELDLEFQTALPNRTELVDEGALEEGRRFLFPAVTQGRLELIPELGTVAEITPRGIDLTQVLTGTAQGQETPIVMQEPRRVTQLTVQQAEVLWVGDWRAPGNDWEGPNSDTINLAQAAQLDDAIAQLTPDQRDQLAQQYGVLASDVESLRTIARNRLMLLSPDVVILSVPVQDALTLKWAFEEPGVNQTLVLRSQGDNSLYFTTSVSLPQLVEQAGLTIPEPSQFGLEPYIQDSPSPRLPPFRPLDLTTSTGPQ